MVVRFMERCIVFGASEGGKNYIQKQGEYEVILLVDNDLKKQKTKFNGFTIENPQKIYEYEYDCIVIASMYYQSITKQLVEMKVPVEKIKYAPKHLMKKNHSPFEDLATYEYTWKLLKNITIQFKQSNIQYFVDFGTLLGIYRSNDLIPWDDDIDIALKIESIEEADLVFKIVNNILNKDDKISWKGNKVFNKSNELIGIDFNMVYCEGVEDFSINFGILRFKNNFAYQIMNYAPQEHFEASEELVVKKVKFKIPFKTEEYLAFTYGEDWKEERRETTFENNTKTFFEPEV